MAWRRRCRASLTCCRCARSASSRHAGTRVRAIAMNDGTHPDLLRRLTELNRIGIALSREKDINRLLEVILVAAKMITNADGGTLYRRHGDQELHFEIMRTDSL